jgi:uncharacterized protein (TIGR02452 family)
MDLRDVAAETLQIVERGGYTSGAGRTVVLREAIEAAERGTVLYTPEDLDALAVPQAGGGRPRVEVTDETTAAAARRLVEAEGTSDVAMLNFASAKHPGGGWLGGARAQEEDLARCSALYRCLLAQPRYYEANRAHPSLLYTDHVIHSPRVPFFRDDRHALLDEPYLASIITAPAPNAGEVLRLEPGAGPQVRATIAARARKVLAVAADRGHRTLVLGAWGCGVFRNDPTHVAGVFADLLEGSVFDHVVFAVYDRSAGRSTLRAFEDRLGS